LNRYRQDSIADNRRGATMWLFLIMLPTLIIICLMCINVAYMNLTRTELRIATDAASRSSGRMFAISGSEEQAMIFGRDAASRNTIGGKPLELSDADFEFGRSERRNSNSRYTFSPLVSISTFEPSHQAISTQVELDVALVVDRSGSMVYADDEVAGEVFPPPSAPAGWDFGQPAPPGCRWFDVANAVDAFLDEMAATPMLENVGLASYADEASIDVPLSGVYDGIVDSLDERAEAFEEGATSIGGGILEGIGLLRSDESRPHATKVVILLTDGVHNLGIDPRVAARRARRAGITIFVVTFSDEVKKHRMRRIAKITSGVHLHAKDGPELVQAFRDIAHQLPTLLTK